MRETKKASACSAARAGRSCDGGSDALLTEVRCSPAQHAAQRIPHSLTFVYRATVNGLREAALYPLWP